MAESADVTPKKTASDRDIGQVFGKQKICQRQRGEQLRHPFPHSLSELIFLIQVPVGHTLSPS